MVTLSFFYFVLLCVYLSISISLTIYLCIYHDVQKKEIPRIFSILPSISLTSTVLLKSSNNGQPIEMTVHSHCVENLDDLLKRGMGVSDWKKTHFFLNTLYVYVSTYQKNHISYVLHVMASFLILEAAALRSWSLVKEILRRNTLFCSIEVMYFLPMWMELKLSKL